MTVGVEDTGDPIKVLFRLGASNEASAAAAHLFARRPEDEEWMAGVFDGAEVRQIASFFAEIPLDTWAHNYRAELATAWTRMGYSRPFDDEQAKEVLDDAQDVVRLFRSAAADHQAVIIKVSA